MKNFQRKGMRKKGLFQGKVQNILLMGALLALGFGASLSAYAQSGSGTCAVLSSGNASTATFYAGFAVPWNIFSLGEELLINADCESGTASVSVGNGDSEMYIYEDAYFSTGGAWQIISLSDQTATSPQSGPWIRGNATTQIDISSTGAGYLLAYTCQMIGGEWKCGCRDENSCGLWQLQEVRSGPPPEITSASEEFYAPGDQVTLSGTGFRDQMDVSLSGYGTLPAEASAGGESLTFTLPEDIPVGERQVSVVGAGTTDTTFAITVVTQEEKEALLLAVEELTMATQKIVTAIQAAEDEIKRKMEEDKAKCEDVFSGDDLASALEACLTELGELVDFLSIGGGIIDEIAFFDFQVNQLIAETILGFLGGGGGGGFEGFDFGGLGGGGGGGLTTPFGGQIRDAETCECYGIPYAKILKINPVSGNTNLNLFYVLGTQKYESHNIDTPFNTPSVNILGNYYNFQFTCLETIPGIPPECEEKSTQVDGFLSPTVGTSE